MFTGGHSNTLTHLTRLEYSTTLLEETQIPHSKMNLYYFVSFDNIRVGVLVVVVVYTLYLLAYENGTDSLFLNVGI
jgi:hypothetical protein